MKFLADFLQKKFDKLRPEFEKGGRFERWHPLFEAKETFLFVTRDRTKSGAHIRDAMDSKRLMSTVIVALLPCLLFGIYNVGHQYYLTQGIQPAFLPSIGIGLRYVVPILIVSYAVGGICELIFSVVRKHEINEGFLVTGMLFPLVLPPTMPLWQVAVGVAFGVVIGKEVFGGTGMNVFNPALVCRAFCFFAYPAELSGDRVWAAKAGAVIDGYSGATPLLHASAHASGQSVSAALDAFGTAANGFQFADFSGLNCFLGLIPGSIGETSTLCCLLGAVVLIATGVGSWRIIVSAIVGALAMGLVMNILTPAEAADKFTALPAWRHLVMGGFMFGAVFMATDPVSAAQTNTAKLIYGFLIGVLCVIIRTVNPAYPEGMMLAILFMNAFAPLIDYFVVDAHMRRRRNRGQVAHA